MADEMLDQLLLMWREQYDEMQEKTANERANLESAANKVADLSEPYMVAMEALHDEIEPIIMQMGSTYGDMPGMVAQYRSGYERSTYNVDKVDVVEAFLDDLLPSAAEQLREAKKTTLVPAKVTVKAV